jgi:hypothetical protein
VNHSCPADVRSLCRSAGRKVPGSDVRLNLTICLGRVVGAAFPFRGASGPDFPASVSRPPPLIVCGSRGLTGQLPAGGSPLTHGVGTPTFNALRRQPMTTRHNQTRSSEG